MLNKYLLNEYMKAFLESLIEQRSCWVLTLYQVVNKVLQTVNLKEHLPSMRLTQFSNKGQYLQWEKVLEPQ